MRTFRTMLKSELKLSLRDMNMVIFAICIPLVVLVILGIIYGNKPAFDGAEYTFLEQSFGALTTIAICAGGVMGLPLVVSDYRSRKILKRFKVTPVSPAVILAVQVVIYTIYSVASLILLYAVSALFFGFQMGGSLLAFLGGYLLVMLSMFSIGMMVGGISPNSQTASVIASLLYFPMLIRMVGDWKLEIMAKKIFEGIWSKQERKDAVLEVYRLLNEYYQSDTKNNQAAASALEGKIARLKNKIDNLISMRADGEITKEEFKSLKDTTEAELNKYMEEKSRMSELSNSESGTEFDIEKIRTVLEEALDFFKPKLDDGIIDKFVSQIIPVDNCRYRWDLNFLPNETQSLVCKVEGRKNHADASIEEENEDEDESPRTYVLSMDYSNISVTAKNAYQSYVLHRRL